MRGESKPCITFTKEQLERLVPLLQEQLAGQFDLIATGLEARLLLNFITERLGEYYYNQGVQDAITMMSQKLDDVYLLVRLIDEDS